MAIKPSKIEAVIALFGGSYNTADANGIVNWKDGHTTTHEEKSAIDVKFSELISVWDAQAYSRNREAEYPSVQECVHAILDDELTALQEKRQAVKTKYPKS